MRYSKNNLKSKNAQINAMKNLFEIDMYDSPSERKELPIDEPP